jgi:hypothetical protein
MRNATRLSKFVFLGLIILMALLKPYPVQADPASFEWGTFDSGGSTSYGVYEADNVTILETGDLVQFIWAGPDGEIDPPQPDGTPSDDDQVLDTSTIENGGSLPPPAQNKGYIPLVTYSFDTGDSQNGGTVYIRAWNASTAASATAYGDSSTGTLSNGGTLNAPRWRMTYTPNAITLSTFRASSASAGWPNWAGLGLLAAAFSLLTAGTFRLTMYRRGTGTR